MSDTPSDRTPRSAQLPANAPKATKRIVQALSELAGPASSARLASRLGVQLTGRVATELASAKLYGFIAPDVDDKLIVSERGEAFIGDDEAAAIEAARDGVMSTGFAPIIKKLVTRQADASIVAVRFEEDRGLNAGPAKNRAAILVKASEETKLIAAGRFDAAAIEDTIGRVGEVTQDEAPPKPKPQAAKAPKAENGKGQINSDGPKAQAAKRQEPKEEIGRPFVQAPSMQVVLQIDASKLTAEEIVTIVTRLKEIDAGSTISS
jgi:hypothetical protein